jgi:hypothetical protein
MARLSETQRARIPQSKFAVPSKDGYPIDTPGRARVALGLVGMHGSPAEKAAVRKKVAQEYPAIEQTKGPAKRNSNGNSRNSNGNSRNGNGPRIGAAMQRPDTSPYRRAGNGNGNGNAAPRNGGRNGGVATTGRLARELTRRLDARDRR